MKKHERLRGFNKRVLNPLMLKIAGKRFSPIAVVHHVGRRSGKPFTTPIIAQPIKGGFLFALTYGADVDWYRNIMAAEGGALRWHGREFAFEKPYPMESGRAMRRFPLPLRVILRLNDTEDFVQVKRAAS